MGGWGGEKTRKKRCDMDLEGIFYDRQDAIC